MNDDRLGYYEFIAGLVIVLALCTILIMRG